MRRLTSTLSLTAVLVATVTASTAAAQEIPVPGTVPAGLPESAPPAVATTPVATPPAVATTPAGGGDHPRRDAPERPAAHGRRQPRPRWSGRHRRLQPLRPGPRPGALRGRGLTGGQRPDQAQRCLHPPCAGRRGPHAGGGRGPRRRRRPEPGRRALPHVRAAPPGDPPDPHRPPLRPARDAGAQRRKRDPRRRRAPGGRRPGRGRAPRGEDLQGDAHAGQCDPEGGDARSRTLGRLAAGFVVPMAAGADIAPMAAAQGGARFESEDSFVEFAAGLLLPGAARGDTASYGGLYGEVAGGYHLNRAALSPYVGGGMDVRLAGGDNLSGIGLVPYAAFGLETMRDSAVRFTIEARLGQNVLGLEYTKGDSDYVYDEYGYGTYGRGDTETVHPTELGLMIGLSI